MKISRNWLAEYVDFEDIDNETYLEHVNTRIAEIEDAYFVSQPINDAIIVQIKNVSVHPQIEKLKIVTVTDGVNSYEVVCGANNVRIGMYSAYVPPGGRVRKPNLSSEDEQLILVEKKAIGGVPSNGILCSESEIGISSDHSGIMDLNQEQLGHEPAIGAKLSSLIESVDFVIDIDNKSLTHRPDLWCHLGFAREICAIYKRQIKQDYDQQVNYEKTVAEHFSKLKPARFKNKIECTDACSRFSLLEISGVRNSPTPYWIKKRLFTIGNSTKSVLVDISNYVLNDVGQPNHAFDAKTLEGQTLFARYAKDKEKFLALDDIERTFVSEDIVIADEVKPLDLAGVIGGKSYSVVADTTEIVLVCSTFDATKIRKASKRHQIRTDSSSRYEKSLSPVQTTLAMLSYIKMLERIGQRPKLEGFSDAPELKLPEKTYVRYNFNEIQDRLQGALNNEDEALGILERLNFTVKGLEAEVPYYRATKDVSISADLIEEVGRSIGYARIPETAPLIKTSGSAKNRLIEVEGSIASLLSALGFNEVYNYTFSSREKLEALGYDTKDVIELENSVDQTLSSLRTTLIPGIIQNTIDNLRYFEEFALFEIGRSYHKTEGVISDDFPPVERRLVTCAIVSTGETTQIKNPLIDGKLGKGVSQFYALNSIVKKICHLLQTKEVQIFPCEMRSGDFVSPVDYRKLKKWMHPYRSSYISIGGLICGHISELRPSYIRHKSTKVTLLELDISALIATQESGKTFKQLPKFPSSFFEISLLASKDELYLNLSSKIQKNLGQVEARTKSLLSHIEPLSVYEGASIPEDKKSISLKFIFQDEEATIQTETLEALRADVITAVQKSGYSLRS